MTHPILLDRARGMLLGLACGDAVGAAVEFKPRGSFPPVTDLLGGGKFRLAPGEWTDDTSMALCLADSLLAVNLGDDADTTAAICGQLAGATHGLSGIPARWLGQLVGYEELRELAAQLVIR